MAQGNLENNTPDSNKDSNEKMDVDEASEEESELEDESKNDEETNRVFLPNYERDKDLPLDYDESAYICYHSVKTGYPCLSFDIIPDNLLDSWTDAYPLKMTVVGGTQVPKSHLNHLLVMEMSNMDRNKISKDDDDDDESESESEDENEDKKPILKTAEIPHSGCVNRVKITNLGSEVFAASWSELGKVHIWNLSYTLRALNDDRLLATYKQKNEKPKPVYTFSGHNIEGYAMEWSPHSPGMLVTGDNNNKIHLWKPLEGSSWHVDQRSLTGHTGSVEDLQWSPNESSVLASCSVDKSIRIWDIRASPNLACMLTRENAHDMDVNVISWNKTDPFILSGGDDGKLCVWDLRKFPGSDPICTFKHHIAPITSVEWHPTDHSVFAACAADDQLTQWDLAIERDDDEQLGKASAEVLALPSQLLFMHLGQKQLKELHWHKQMPGVLVSTGENGLDIIKTLSV